MYFDHVVMQGLIESEIYITKFTTECFLASVPGHMTFKICGTHKAFITVCALVKI
jgi:hypothetical protein